MTARSPRPATGILIVRDARLLLVRRRTGSTPARWDLPGDFLQAGESPEAGARRAVREQLSVELDSLHLAQAALDSTQGSGILYLIYQACLPRGEPHAGSGAGTTAWFPHDALPTNRATPFARRILERWQWTFHPAGLCLLGGEILRPDDRHLLARILPPLHKLPAGWAGECGRWRVHDGFLCGVADGERPAVLWLDRTVKGDHMILFEAHTVPPHRNDLNCIWEGSGRLAGRGPDRACTIGGVGGWWDQLTGIERYPEGGVRATSRCLVVESGRDYRIAGGRRGASDFLFVDGQLAMQVDDPEQPRRASSRVALSTWNSHIHIRHASVYRLPPREI
ncbi:MAG: NUDIX hydrolase [Acidobacteriota bacterium]